MKKLISMVFILAFLPALALAGDSDVRGTNVKVHDTASYTFKSGSSLSLDGNVMKFGSLVSTAATSPTAAYQVIMSTKYQIMLSTASGGDWFSVGGK